MEFGIFLLYPRFGILAYTGILEWIVLTMQSTHESERANRVQTGLRQTSPDLVYGSCGAAAQALIELRAAGLAAGPPRLLSSDTTYLFWYPFHS